MNKLLLKEEKKGKEENRDYKRRVRNSQRIKNMWKI
jgi:hypothetical protein